MRNRGLSNLAFLFAVAVLLLAAAAFVLVRARAERPVLDTPYHAVVLSNGTVYFGRLEGLGTPFPVLREVYYVQSAVNPETKAVNNVLVKRGKEWHGPDRMILNAQNIVFIEPVGRDSKVAQLIADSKK